MDEVTGKVSLHIINANELIPFMTEVRDIGTVLKQRWTDLENLVQQVKHLKYKTNVLDYQKRHDSLCKEVQDIAAKIAIMDKAC